MGASNKSQGPKRRGRPSTGVPAEVERDARTINRLRDTLLRAQPKGLAKSLRLQLAEITRLALMARRRREITFLRTVGDLAKRCGCVPEQVRRNLRVMENMRILTEVVAGGGRLPTEYTFHGEMLFRALVGWGCNPSDDLRARLRGPENPDSGALSPRNFTPELSPDICHSASPELGEHFPHENQIVARSNNFVTQKQGRTPELSPVLNAYFMTEDQYVTGSDNSSANVIPPIYGPLAHADLIPSLTLQSLDRDGQEPSVTTETLPSPFVAPAFNGACYEAGEVATDLPETPPVPKPNLREPPAGRSADASLFVLEENFSERAACGETPSVSTDATSAEASSPALSDDARDLLKLLAAGSTTCGATASKLGWGNSRAMVAESELITSGLARYNHLGRTVLSNPSADQPPPLCGGRAVRHG